jgi:hypothetical protein
MGSFLVDAMQFVRYHEAVVSEGFKVVHFGGSGWPPSKQAPGHM